MTHELSDRFYRGLGIFAMVLTLLATLGAVLDPTLWFCAAFGYATALAIAWMQHDWRRREARMAAPTPHPEAAATAMTEEGR